MTKNQEGEPIYELGEIETFLRATQISRDFTFLIPDWLLRHH